MIRALDAWKTTFRKSLSTVIRWVHVRRFLPPANKPSIVYLRTTSRAHSQKDVPTGCTFECLSLRSPHLAFISQYYGRARFRYRASFPAPSSLRENSCPSYLPPSHGPGSRSHFLHRAQVSIDSCEFSKIDRRYLNMNRSSLRKTSRERHRWFDGHIRR